jgi:hypothetical protein
MRCERRCARRLPHERRRPVYFTGNWTGLASADNGATYLATIVCSGSAGSPIVYDWSGATVNCNFEVARGISIGAISNYELRYPTVTRCGTTAAYGINIDGSVASFDLSVTVRNPVITDIVAADGLTVALRGKGANLTVINPKIENVSDDGIWIDGNNSLVYCDDNGGTTCYIKRVGTGAAVTGDCVQFGATPATALNGEIRKVYCDHTSVLEKQCFLTNGLGLFKVTDSVCLLPAYNGTTLSNGIYGEGMTDARRNFLQGGRIGISTATLAGATTLTQIIASNVIVGAGYRSISIGGGTLATQTSYIHGNSVNCSGFSNSTGGGLYLDGVAGSTAIVRNNSFINCPLVFNGVAANVVESITHNNDFGSTTRFTSVSDGGTNGTSNPLLNAGDSPVTAFGFRPTAASPLCNAGYKSPPIAGVDYFGKRFGPSPTIGAVMCN